MFILNQIFKKDWIYLGKFCFITEIGKVSMSLEYPLSYAKENLIFYYDSQWPMVYPEVATNVSS